jgi:hypothetical protein
VILSTTLALELQSKTPVKERCTLQLEEKCVCVLPCGVSQLQIVWWRMPKAAGAVQLETVFRRSFKPLKPIRILFGNDGTSMQVMSNIARKVKLRPHGQKRWDHYTKIKIKHLRSKTLWTHNNRLVLQFQGKAGGAHWRNGYKRNTYLLGMVHKRMKEWRKFRRGRPFMAYPDFRPWRIMQWLNAISKFKFGLARQHLINWTRRTNRNLLLKRYSKMLRRIHKSPNADPRDYHSVLREMEVIYGAPLPADKWSSMNAMNFEKMLFQMRLDYTKKH